MRARQNLWILIVVTTLLRLLWAASLGPGNDEAYHYLFAQHRDWSYFDHPPMLMVVESLGIGVAGGLGNPFAMRIGFIALFAASSWLMFRLTSRFFGPEAGFFAAFALNVSAYFTAAASSFALPDGPLIFFWLLTLNAIASALDQPGKIMPWVWVGLAWGGSLLSKYHGVFLPAGLVLFLLLDRTRRIRLMEPGPYLATAIGLMCFAPVIYWNMHHGWASFAFQGGRAAGNSFRFRPETLLGAFAGQAAYLLPWVYVALMIVTIREARKAWPDHLSEESSNVRFLLCEAFVPIFVINTVACTRAVLPHWALAGYLPLFPLLGKAWAEKINAQPARTRRELVIFAVLPIVIASIYIGQSKYGLLQSIVSTTLGYTSAPSDPTADQFGWDQVADEIRRRGLLDEPGTFLFTGSWYNSGQLAFALREDSIPVLCYNSFDARSFRFWNRPEDYVGKDGILVSINRRIIEPGIYDRWFRKIEAIGEFEVLRAGKSARTIRLYRCVAQKQPFPFDGRDPVLAERLLDEKRTE